MTSIAAHTIIISRQQSMNVSHEIIVENYSPMETHDRNPIGIWTEHVYASMYILYVYVVVVCDVYVYNCMSLRV